MEGLIVLLVLYLIVVLLVGPIWSFIKIKSHDGLVEKLLQRVRQLEAEISSLRKAPPATAAPQPVEAAVAPAPAPVITPAPVAPAPLAPPAPTVVPREEIIPPAIPAMATPAPVVTG